MERVVFLVVFLVRVFGVGFWDVCFELVMKGLKRILVFEDFFVL